MIMFIVILICALIFITMIYVKSYNKISRELEQMKKQPVPILTKTMMNVKWVQYERVVTCSEFIDEEWIKYDAARQLSENIIRNMVILKREEFDTDHIIYRAKVGVVVK